MGAERIFDDVERSDPAPGRFGETTFEILNRAPGPYWSRVRDLIEDWFSRLPSEARAHVRSRLRARDDRQFRAGFWELYCHESLRRLGYEITCEPVQPGVPRQPDFLAEGPSETFVMEVTAVGDSGERVAADRREAEVLAVIDRVQTTNFFLSLETHAVGPGSPPATRLRRQLERWLASLDPDDVKRSIDEEGITFGPSVPRWEWKEAGWHVVFRPLPIKPEARGKPGLRAVGMRSPGMGFVIDDTTRLRGAIRDKAGAYGDLGVPYIVAGQLDGSSAGDFAVMNALYGHLQVAMGQRADGTLETSETRAPDGVWFGPTGIQNRRLSGVLIARHLVPWTITTTVPTLWHHPSAHLPLTIDAPMWRIARVDSASAIAFENPRLPIGAFFGLSPQWPGPEEPWPSE